MKNKLLCLLLIAIPMSSYAESFKKIDGGKVSNGNFTIKCEDKRGWSKCGLPDPPPAPVKVCKHDANHRMFESRAAQCMIKPSRCNPSIMWNGVVVAGKGLGSSAVFNSAPGKQKLRIGGYYYERMNGHAYSAGGVCRTPAN